MQELKYHKKVQTIDFSRSPTLDTVFMVEETIKKYSGEYNRSQLWKKLPRKVMWQTYKIILNYLETINKIGVSSNGKLVYIWNPKLAKVLLKKKGLKVVVPPVCQAKIINK